eukprot:5021391-Pyramimonas_sp.AAC.1
MLLHDLPELEAGQRGGADLSQELRLLGVSGRRYHNPERHPPVPQSESDPRDGENRSPRQRAARGTGHAAPPG